MMEKLFCIKNLVVFSLGVLSMLSGIGESRAESGATNCRDVIVGIEKRYNGYDSWRIMNMEITDSNGGKKMRRILAAHQNTGVHRRLRSKVLEPAELKDFEAMAYDYFGDKESDKVWTWLPSQQKTHEVKSEDLSGRLYGSDLSIGEMLIRRAKDYECKYLGEETYKGLPVWKVWVNPLKESEVIRLGLRDGEVWVEKSTFLPVWSTFNADAPSEQRVFTTDKMRWVDGVYVPAYFKVFTRKEGRVISTSVFEVEGERFNINLPSEWFDIKDLGGTTSGWSEWRSNALTN
ncbi:outer membrane lipoprotein-sorting protein [Azospirillum griseum]|uniref:Outer membrane lipoprotein-sorting protein n=1 Tax=Azospirillum griseum TaxID=2496639 RepID=A0A431VIR6_9PROT|nr:outer membrane lipoprotein-sorting protein [Azospirillum griseum]RTR21107.1 outer membrane lipoprotein-sorting protein [Azospirillum griseum]